MPSNASNAIGLRVGTSVDGRSLYLNVAVGAILDVRPANPGNATFAISIAPIGSTPVNQTFTVSGTLTGYSTAPTLTYTDDGGTAQSLPSGSSVTLVSFRFTHPVFTVVGQHSIVVRDAAHSVSATVPVTVTTISGTAINITAITSPLVSTAFPVSGALTGYSTAPTLTYSDDGGSFVALPAGATPGLVPIPRPLATASSGTWTVTGIFNGMPYAVLLPSGYDATRYTYPLLLCLHSEGPMDDAVATTSSNFLTAVIQPESYDIFDDNPVLAPSSTLWPKTARKNYPAIIVVPANDLADSSINNNWGGYTAAITAQGQTAHDLVVSLMGQLAVDPLRVYVCGYSYGGLGAYEQVYRWPSLYAGAICMGGEPNTTLDLNTWAAALKQMPIWAIHCSSDTAISYTRDQQGFALLSQSAGLGLMQFTTVASNAFVGNGMPTDNRLPARWEGMSKVVYWDWLFSQAKSPSSVATVTSTTFSFTHPGMAAGSHTLSVRDSNAAPTTGSSNYTVIGGSSLAITMSAPTSVIARNSFTVTGTLTGYAAPPALFYADDTGTSVVLGTTNSASVTATSYSFTHPAFTVVAHHTIYVRDTVGTTASAAITVTSTATESVSGTQITAIGQPDIIDSAGNTWNFIYSGATYLNQTTINGAVDTTTAWGTLLLYYNHQIYQQNTSAAWWVAKSATPGSWTATTDPRLSPTISVSAPSSVPVNSTFTVTGSLTSYATAPTLTYADDAGTAVALPSGSTVSTTAYSFTHPAFTTAGTHTIKVADTTGHSGQTSLTVTAVVTPGIAINSTPSVGAGSIFTVSGTLTNFSSAPTLTYADDGGAAVALPGTSTVTATSFSFQHPALSVIGTHSIVIADNGGHSSAPANVVVTSAVNESASGTQITAPGQPDIIDASGNHWNLFVSATKQNEVSVNGVADVNTGWVALLLYYNHKVYQENTSGSWYVANSTTPADYTATTDPRPPITVSISAPASVAVNTAFTVSGALGGMLSVPTLTYVDDGGAAKSLPSGATVSTTAYSFTHPAFTTGGTHTVLVQDNAGHASTPANITVTGGVTESKSGTQITGAGQADIIDASGNKWNLVSGTNPYQVSVNGTVDANTGWVMLLLYYNHKVYQENTSGSWYVANSTTPGDWTATTDPRPSTLYGFAPVGNARSLASFLCAQTATGSKAGQGSANFTYITNGFHYLNPLDTAPALISGLTMVRDDTAIVLSGFSTLIANGLKICLHPHFNTGSGVVNSWSTYNSVYNAAANTGALKIIEGILEVENYSWGFVNTGTVYLAKNGSRYSGWQGAIMFNYDIKQNYGSKAKIGLYSLALSPTYPNEGRIGGDGATATSQLGLTLSQITDFGNFHFYAGNGHCPSHDWQYTSWFQTETEWTWSLPTLVTETGFADSNLVSNREGTYGDRYVNARYLLNNILWQFSLNQKRASNANILYVIYELIDDNGQNIQGVFGIFDVNGNPKTAAVALRNMLAILGDTGANAATYVPTPYNVTASGFPAQYTSHNGTYTTGFYVWLQKSDGSNWVAVVCDQTIYNNSDQELAPVTYNITINLPAASSNIQVYDPIISSSVQRTTSGSSVTVSVSDHPIIIGIH